MPALFRVSPPSRRCSNPPSNLAREQPLITTIKMLGRVVGALLVGHAASTVLRPCVVPMLAPSYSRALRTTTPSLAAYYETIDGVKYDREALDVARESVAGKGDGRVSLSDAQTILNTILDGGGVTAIEFRTAFHVSSACRG